MITTTPGDLTTREGLQAFEDRNKATPWNDDYYKLSDQELLDMYSEFDNGGFVIF